MSAASNFKTHIGLLNPKKNYVIFSEQNDAVGNSVATTGLSHGNLSQTSENDVVLTVQSIHAYEN